MSYDLVELLGSYEIYLNESIGYDDEILRNYYADVTNKMKNDFTSSDFIISLNDSLKDYNQDYISEHNFVLLDEKKKVELKIKPYDSMIEKCFKKDVLETNLLDVLQRGDYDALEKVTKYNQLNCFESFSDIIRSRITVNYMDGALTVLDEIEKLAIEKGLTCCKSYKSNDDGYYALHFDVESDFEIPNIKRKTKKIKAKVEIQINTAVQNLLVDLSHELYEKTRKRLNVEEIQWQWIHDSEEFVPNYLGHIAHYIEGMILNVRDKTRL